MFSRIKLFFSCRLLNTFDNTVVAIASIVGLAYMYSCTRYKSSLYQSRGCWVSWKVVHTQFVCKQCNLMAGEGESGTWIGSIMDWNWLGGMTVTPFLI